MSLTYIFGKPLDKIAFLAQSRTRHLGQSQKRFEIYLRDRLKPGAHPTNHLKIKIILTFSYLLKKVKIILTFLMQIRES